MLGAHTTLRLLSVLPIFYILDQVAGRPVRGNRGPVYFTVDKAIELPWKDTEMHFWDRV